MVRTALLNTPHWPFRIWAVAAHYLPCDFCGLYPLLVVLHGIFVRILALRLFKLQQLCSPYGLYRLANADFLAVSCRTVGLLCLQCW